MSYGQNIVTMILIGEADSYELARKNALRYSIEKVYGTYISSNSVISNDVLVKDEIYSFSNGTISNLEEVSSIVMNGKHIVTLKVTVSPEKLVAFVRENGQNITYDAKSFVSGIKAISFSEKLAEESEYNIMHSLIYFSRKVLNNCFDYKIISSKPYLGLLSGWSIDLDLKIYSNENLIHLIQHIEKTLNVLDYSYSNELMKDWGLKFKNQYGSISNYDYKGKIVKNKVTIEDVVIGSSAFKANLKRGDMITAYRIGNSGDYIPLTKQGIDKFTTTIRKAFEDGTNLNLEIISEDPQNYQINYHTKRPKYKFLPKKYINVTPDIYTIRTRRKDDDRHTIGKPVFNLKFNGQTYKLRSNQSRRIIHDFISKDFWSTVNSFKVKVVAGKYTRELTQCPININRWNYDTKRNEFADDCSNRSHWNTLSLKDYSGIESENMEPEEDILYMYDHKQTPVAYSLSRFTSNFATTVNYSYQDNETSLEFISSIEEFKVIRP